ncbi:MAG: RCC1 domain-containing protein [Sandaracinaceae bacterium]
MRVFTLLVGLAMLAGCKEPRVLPEVEVILEVDSADLASARWLRISVFRDDVDDPLIEQRIIGIGSAPDQIGFPESVYLTPEGGDSSRSWGIEAELFFSEESPTPDQVPDRRARAFGNYAPGRVVPLHLALSDACPLACGEGQTCYGGECVGARFDVRGADPGEPICGTCTRASVREADCDLVNDNEPCGCPGDVCIAGACQIASSVNDLAAAVDSTCATVRSSSVDRGLYCWGSNDASAIGLPGVVDADTPTLVDGARFAYIDLGGTRLGNGSGEAYGCGVVGSELRCWGANSANLRLGPSPGELTAPTPIDVVDSAAEVSLGGAHVCVLQSDGNVACLGRNAEGQLGIGGPLGGPAVGRPGVVAAAPTPPWTRLALGHEFSCALDSGGVRACWGKNDLGQLGISTAEPEVFPIAAMPSPRGPVAEIAAGAFHACARYENGEIECWGGNGFGNGGMGTTRDAGVPQLVDLQSDGQPVLAQHLFCHTSNCCAVARDDGEDGYLYCWGRNENGQVGNGTIAAGGQFTPTRLAVRPGWRGYSAGRGHSCAVRTTGDVYCWGANDRGQLGLGHRERRLRPTRVCIPE